MTTKTYNVGIYCRLSNDDERDGESVSIENQKLLLQNYVRQRGWNEIDTYIDDGYSGTNFDRPGVKRLIEDAKAKRINVILVKDLSRFGRNYIEFGQYTDYLFPSLGCRFIALNNGIDTESTNGSTDVMCFLNLFNEFYSRDTSKKVKAVKKACAENGKFMGTYPAYGYKRDPADKHHLVIDEDTAPIVRRIFSFGLICRCTLLMVCKSCSRPFAERYCACTGIRAVSAAASALMVSIPREGVQSNRI